MPMSQLLWHVGALMRSSASLCSPQAGKCTDAKCRSSFFRSCLHGMICRTFGNDRKIRRSRQSELA